MSKMRLFVPIQKVDEEQRLVYGTLTQEVLDKSGEMIDYEKSKPYFQSWSEGIQKATNGKSAGNMRVMHTNKVAGIFTDIHFNDDAKAVEVCGKVIDDQEWEMVKAGGYTGFSIGGKYVERWEEDGVKRFVANPSEGSLVDNPCVPTATFAMVKANGVEEQVEFKLWQPTNDQVAEVAQALAKDAGGNWTDFIETARDSLLKAKASQDDDGDDDGDSKSDGEDDGDGDEEDKKSKKLSPSDQLQPSGEEGDWRQVWETKDGQTFATKAEARSHAAELKAKEAAAPLSEAIDGLRDAIKGDSPDKPYGDVEYADPANGKYPIDTAKHIRAAWSYINMPKNQKDYTSAEVSKIKAKIVAAWKDKIDKDGPPSADKMALVTDLGKAFALLAAMQETRVEKGLYSISQVARMLSGLACIAQDTVWEEQAENDSDSKLPQQAMDLVAALRTFLVEMVNEEVAELMTGLTQQGGEVVPLVAPSSDVELIEYSARVEGLVKVDTGLLEKVGRRHNAADMESIQKMHDSSMALGAKCMKSNCGDMDAKADDPTMTKLAAVEEENEALKKQMADTVPVIERLKADVEALKKQPMPAAPRTHVVGKGEDNGGPTTDPTPMTAEDLLSKYTPDELSSAAIRLAQRRPIPAIRRG